MSPTTSDRQFVPIAPNPYIVGNPVRNPAMFFGREPEFELVQKRFKPARHGSLLVFCGERRCGKTSILLQIQQGRLGEEFIPVLIDMQAMAVENETEFLSRIAQEIVDQLEDEEDGIELPDFSRGKPSDVFRRFIEAILARNPHRKLLLLFDEYELFEDKLDSGVLTKDVLRILSNLMENLPTFLIFTGSQHLEERRAEYWEILQKAHDHRRISYLQPADAERLIQQPLADLATYAEGTVRRIMRLTAGHPFYTQAVCQNIVDALNEGRTNEVTEGIVSGVAELIVENPFPQMTFLWDTLDQEQKLTLALLAETLDDADAWATAEQLVATRKKSNYPLRMSRAAVATALDALFKQELLNKDSARSPGYAFRMDLWRLWIKRMHSVWQVMREEHLSIRPPPISPKRVVALSTGLLAVLGAVVGWLVWRDRTNPSAIVPAPSRSGYLRILAEPPAAVIELDGKTVGVGVGEWGSVMRADSTYTVRLKGPAGYLDSTFAVSVTAAETTNCPVVLRPQQPGGLRIVVDPPAAEIWLNGERIGKGNAQREDLPVTKEHQIVARLANYQEQTRSVHVRPGVIEPLQMTLQPITVNLLIKTDPSEAALYLNDQKLGNSPYLVRALACGTHRFRAVKDGYVSRDTSLSVTQSTSELSLPLVAEARGILIVRGAPDEPSAKIYIDDKLVGSAELLTSKERSVEPGHHTIRVVFRNGSDSTSVKVPPGGRVEVVWEEQKLRSLP